MQRRKQPELASPSGLQRLVGHTAMGAAMGLGFALMPVPIDPADMPILQP
jgi:hypothetical protein